MRFEREKVSFLKEYIKYMVRTDPNARSFLTDGTVTMDGKEYHQYFFFNPDVRVSSADLANMIHLNGQNVDEVYTEESKAGVRVRVGFCNGRKPKGFERSLRCLEKEYVRLLTYRDCRM